MQISDDGDSEWMVVFEHCSDYGKISIIQFGVQLPPATRAFITKAHFRSEARRAVPRLPVKERKAPTPNLIPSSYTTPFTHPLRSPTITAHHELPSRG
jgi:hypothetical protein